MGSLLEPMIGDRERVRLIQKCLHAESAASGFLELGSFHNDGEQAFLGEDAGKIVTQVGSEETSVGDDAIAHELHRLFTGQFMDPGEAYANGLQRRWRKC